MPIHTDREIKANRPDIIIDDVSVLSEYNTSLKVVE